MYIYVWSKCDFLFNFQAMSVVYLITYMFGYEVWKFQLVGLSGAEYFEIVMYRKYLSLHNVSASHEKELSVVSSF